MALQPKARAYLFAVTAQTAEADWTTAPSSAVTVQFNPTTLQYSLQNTLEKRSRDANAAQFVSQSSAKLELDLLFDSTHDGADVRVQTRKLRDFLKPQANQNDAPPVVGFAWGTFRFKGVAESFRETLDFFSSEGVPLRSTIKLTLAAQSARDIFTDEDISKKAEGMAAEVTLTPVPSSGVNRDEARNNNFESMRNPGSSVAAVPAGQPQLKPAAGFAAGGAGIGLGAGAGLGLSAGAGIGLSAGIGLGGGAGIGLSAGAGIGMSAGAGIGLGGSAGLSAGGAFGAGAGMAAGASAGFAAGASAGFSAGAGVSASAGFGATAGAIASAGVSSSLGAFNGLRTSTTVTRQRSTLVVAAAPILPAASGEFALGGAAISASSSGLRADVGISARIRFD
jgi:hypothetical protein